MDGPPLRAAAFAELALGAGRGGGIRCQDIKGVAPISTRMSEHIYLYYYARSGRQAMPNGYGLPGGSPTTGYCNMCTWDHAR